MKKKDLKSGMIVECRSGERAVVIIDTCINKDCIVYSGRNWTELDGFNEDLIWHADDEKRTEYAKTVDIMKIYKPRVGSDFLSFVNGFKSSLGSRDKEHELLWERKEVEEMTLKKVCELLGREIKIVK